MNDKEIIGQVPDELINQVVCGECSELMATLLPDNCIDLTITSPPYDSLRDYEGYTFDFEPIASELYRVTKPGGVVVWVVGDATVDGSETCTSAIQKLHFKSLGFNMYDTMIYLKSGFRYPFPNRYHQVFEYMFVLTKGKIKTFNPIKDRKNIHTSRRRAEMKREVDGSASYRKPFQATEYGKRYNVWQYQPSEGKVKFDGHPAIFPEALSRDHILSWSNPGDVVLDPMCGSGTVPKMCVMTERQFVGIDISSKYVELATKRFESAQEKYGLKLF